MKLKDLATVIMSLSALVGSVAGLITAMKAQAEVEEVDERHEEASIHTQIEEGKEDLALRARIEDLERRLAEVSPPAARTTAH